MKEEIAAKEKTDRAAAVKDSFARERYEKSRMEAKEKAAKERAEETASENRKADMKLGMTAPVPEYLRSAYSDDFDDLLTVVAEAIGPDEDSVAGMLFPPHPDVVLVALVAAIAGNWKVSECDVQRLGSEGNTLTLCFFLSPPPLPHPIPCPPKAPMVSWMARDLKNGVLIFLDELGRAEDLIKAMTMIPIPSSSVADVKRLEKAQEFEYFWDYCYEVSFFECPGRDS